MIDDLIFIWNEDSLINKIFATGIMVFVSVCIYFTVNALMMYAKLFLFYQL